MSNRVFSRRSFVKAAAGLFVAPALTIEPIQRFFPLDRTMIQTSKTDTVYSSHIELPWVTSIEINSLSEILDEDEFLSSYYANTRPILTASNIRFEPGYDIISSHLEDGITIIDEARLTHIALIPV